jgi:hypothetical protein
MGHLLGYDGLRTDHVQVDPHPLLLDPPSLALLVILTVIPQATTEPNQTGLTRNAAQPDLARPDWTVENRRLAVIS